MTLRQTTTRDRHRAVIARGQPPCALCHEPIDYTLSMLTTHGPRCKGGTCQGCIPHPLRYEVDHIVPLAKGGPDTLENKQASHRKCNRAKWHTDDKHDAPRLFVTSRTW